MDLVALWEHIPSLLATCVGESILVLRHLRLVSKEASRVVLLDLKSFSLTIRGPEEGPSVNRARFLSSTSLLHLDVYFAADASSPALMRFINQAGDSLQYITTMGLHLQKLCTSLALMDEPLRSLVSSCPALKSLTCEGHISPNVLQRLGEACPLLSALTILGLGVGDEPYLQDTLLCLQPALLPQLTSFAFHDCAPDFQPPDMSDNHSLHYIDMTGCTFSHPDHVERLPYTLRGLTIGHFTERTLHKSQDKILLPSLPSLCSLKLGGLSNFISNTMLAQLMQAAPALKSVKPGPQGISLNCDLSESSTTSNSVACAVMNKAMAGHPALKNAVVCLDCCFRKNPSIASLLPCIASLPCMPGFANIKVLSLEGRELSPLLALFPDVSHLRLETLWDQESEELKELAVCVHLTKLTLAGCDMISPMGLLWLCQICPSLSLIECCRGTLLQGPAVEECRQLLQRHGLTAQVVDTSF